MKLCYSYVLCVRLGEAVNDVLDCAVAHFDSPICEVTHVRLLQNTQ